MFVFVRNKNTDVQQLDINFALSVCNTSLMFVNAGGVVFKCYILVCVVVGDSYTVWPSRLRQLLLFVETTRQTSHGASFVE